MPEARLKGRTQAAIVSTVPTGRDFFNFADDPALETPDYFQASSGTVPVANIHMGQFALVFWWGQPPVYVGTAAPRLSTGRPPVAFSRTFPQLYFLHVTNNLH